MFIKITFKQSEIKSYASKEDYNNFISNKDIPKEQRINIFTNDEVNKLSSILDTPLDVEEIKIICLEKQEIFKKTWFYGDNSKQDEDEYNENYKLSEGIQLYAAKPNKEYVVDSDLLMATTSDFETKVLYTVNGVLKDIPSANYSTEIKLLDTLINLENKLSIFDKTQQFNTRVGVHISDLGMLNIKEVDVLEDACTDRLQEWLDEGWRILAVCPQPDQRRPDYIVGRNERMTTRERREKSCK